MTKTIERKRWTVRRIVAWVSIAVILAAFALYVLPSLIFSTSILSGGVTTRQLEQLESQDHFVQAVLVQTIPSFSIEPYGFHLYIERANARGITGKPVMEGIELRDLNLTWLAPKVLQISYSSGCIGLFRNNWLAVNPDGHPYFDRDGHPYSIEVRLKPPSDIAPHTCD